MELIYRGSVKDLYKNNNNLVFKYSNRYSIFDWGEMPDEIPYKGEALAFMAASFFEYLREKKVSSHYISMPDKGSIEVKAVEVHRPEWKNDHYDYSVYAHRPTDCLVPLEVIFRKHLGQGNSLEARLKKNPAYLQDLELASMPQGESSFDPPIIEFSTKLETSDRYLSKKEIAALDVVSEMELANIKKYTNQVVHELNELFSSFGVKLWDGKVEYAFGGKDTKGERSLLLVDSIGPDELRLTYEGLPLSKEFLRQLYRDSTWAQAVKKSKELADERRTPDWKSICEKELKETPELLSQAQIEVSSLLYQALANEVAKAVGRPLPFAENKTIKNWHSEALKILGK